ncbi:MAG: DedA family protein [Hyphomicrobiaceae bacterium]|nr:DedA family protein [Hyphomicrobiaceae bacterium]MCC0011380.1 DedA family protein [Hyphomicrobiaceae bacterium]
MVLFAATGSLWENLIGFAHENIALIEPIVFALGFAESIVLVSMLVPSTILFLAIGGVHNAAGGNFFTLWLAGAAGAYLGDIVSYALGRYFRADIANLWPFSKKPEWYVLARGFFRSWGAPGIIASKFLGMMRPFVPVVAGAARMRWLPFLLASAVSCLIWAGAFLGPGHGIGWLMK